MATDSQINENFAGLIRSGQQGAALPVVAKSTGGAVVSQGSFIKAIRSDEAMELLARSHTAFVLLYVIAYRAQWRDRFNRHGLRPGQAFLGDFKQCGMSQQQYRTAKKILEENNFASFRATNKGTIATLSDTRIFDINLDSPNRQTNTQATDGQQTNNDYLESQERLERKKRSKKGLGTHFMSNLIQFEENLERPNYEDFMTFVGTEGLDQTFSDAFFRQHEADGWRIKGQPIRDWRKALVAFCDLLEVKKHH